jgi:hypothetical protein
VDINDDDALITAYITAAREKCESFLSRSFITTGWRLSLDGFPGQINRFASVAGYAELGIVSLYGAVPEWALAGTAFPIVTDRARLIAVSSLSYLDQNGNRQTMDPSAYSVEALDGGRISPAYGTSWPPARVYPGSILVDLTLGYGPDASYVPSVIKQSILMTVGHLYENRAAVTELQTFELALGVRWLLHAEDWGCRP